MLKFSNNPPSITISNILYSEYLALYLVNPTFFDFLNDEKWKYFLNNEVFYNSTIYELNNWKNIKVQKEYTRIDILNDWSVLKQIPIIANQINYTSESDIVVAEDHILIGQDLYRPKLKEDTITQTDLISVVSDLENIYTDNTYNAYLKLFISHIKNYVIPEYSIGINYFEQIFKEKGMILDFNNYSNYTTQGLGIRFDALPNLYYNNFMNLCIDLINYPPAFRDYQLMKDTWKHIKHSDLNIPLLLPVLKNYNRDLAIKNFLEKYYSLSDYEYFTIEDDKVIKRLSCNDTIFNINSIKYYKDLDSNITISIIVNNVDFRFKICSELAVSRFEYILSIS